MKAEVTRPSRPLLLAFHAYLHWYVRRHFRALRAAHTARIPAAVTQSPQRVIVVLNHPSWWDPLTCMLLSRTLSLRADHYAPMDAAELQRYRFFTRLGLFPVEPSTPRGAAQFLRAGSIILARPNSVLWVTPQGSFTDVRQRPPALRSGVASLIARSQPVTLLPLALEYIYWNERLPEILANWGKPVQFADATTDTAAIQAKIVASLAAAQDELALLSSARDPQTFDTLLSGKSGLGSIYGLRMRLRRSTPRDSVSGVRSR
jgi:1-acyl-sn-glycerol-3-phosphate acyltransferase